MGEVPGCSDIIPVSTWETEVGVQGLPRLQSEFEASLSTLT